MAETRMEVDSMDTALAVFGSCDENIRLLEQSLGVTAVCRGTELKFSGPEDAVQKARRAVDAMLALREGGTPLEEQTVRYCISLADAGEEEKVQELAGGCIAITAKGRPVRPKTLGQKQYVEAILKMPLPSRGPAGTGKTYLAVAMAVKAFKGAAGKPHYSHAPCCRGGREAGLFAG